MSFSLFEFLQIGAPLLAIGGAYGGAKVAINGTKERMRNLEQHVDAKETTYQKQHVETIERLTRIETKLDAMKH